MAFQPPPPTKSSIQTRRRRRCFIPTVFLILLRLAENSESFFHTITTTHPSSSPYRKQQSFHQVFVLSAKTTLPNQRDNSRSPSTKHQQNNNSPPSIDRQIAQAGRRGQTDKALRLFHSLPQPVTIRQLNAALDACACARPSPRLDTAFSLLDTTRTRTPVNVYTFGALLNGLRRAGDLDTALHLLDTVMPYYYNVPPNAVIYQSVIATAAAVGNVQVAFSVLERCRNDPNKEANLTIIAYNAALAAAARAGCVERAVAVLEELIGQQQNSTQHNSIIPDAVTFGTVMAACEAAGEWERVVEYARNYTDQLDDQGLATAIHACQQLGWATTALELLHQQRRPDIVTYRLAISACARGGAWREGMDLLHHVPVNDTVAYTAAMTGCDYAGEWREACLLLARMRKNGCAINCVTMAAVMGACATACAKQQQQLRVPGGHGDDDSNDSNKVLDDSPKRKALQLLMAMRKDDTVVDPNINIYNAAMRACAEARDPEKAFSVLQLLEEDNVQPNVVTFGILMTACERVASEKKIGTVFRLMRERNIQPNEIVYGAAISCCRKAGKPEHVYKLVEAMKNKTSNQDHELRPNTATLNTAMLAQTESLSKTPDAATAVIAMARAQSIFDWIEHPDRSSYEILIRGYCAARRPGQAHRWLSNMAAKFRPEPPEVGLYTLTVDAYERNGKPREALRLMESMRESGYDFYQSKMLNTIFKRLVRLANAALG